MVGVSVSNDFRQLISPSRSSTPLLNLLLHQKRRRQSMSRANVNNPDLSGSISVEMFVCDETKMG